MTSLKLLFRPSRVEGKEGILYIRVIHDRVARQVNLGCKLRSLEWKDGRVDAAAATDATRRTYLEAVNRMISESLSRLGAIIDRLEQSGEEYTSTRVVEAYRQTDDDEGKLCVFARKVTDHLRRIGKVRLSETYTSSVNSFMRFRGENGDIPMTEMNSDLMKEYEHYLLDECGLNPNTGSFYMRNLRALYNRAVEKGLTTDRTPFRHVYTGVAKTMKRAVPAEVIRKIKGLDLTLQPALAQARDYFSSASICAASHLSIFPNSKRPTSKTATCATAARRRGNSSKSNGNTRCRKSSAATTVKARPICCRCSMESVATRAGITRTPCNG